HDVVVLEEMLAHLEVVRLHLLLRVLDGAGEEAVLDGHALLDPHAVHHRGDALASEDAQEVVLERQEEARSARVALAAGTAAEPVVDAPRLMALGAKDDAAAGGDHLFLLLRAL